MSEKNIYILEYHQIEWVSKLSAMLRFNPGISVTLYTKGLESIILQIPSPNQHILVGPTKRVPFIQSINSDRGLIGLEPINAVVVTTPSDNLKSLQTMISENPWILSIVSIAPPNTVETVRDLLLRV